MWFQGAGSARIPGAPVSDEVWKCSLQGEIFDENYIFNIFLQITFFCAIIRHYRWIEMYTVSMSWLST